MRRYVAALFAVPLTMVAVAVVLGLVTSRASAEEAPRVVEIVGPIDGDTVDAVEKALDGVKAGEAVDVRIDSSGGSVFAGLRVIELIRQSNAVTTCYVGSAALSMAGVILESPACGTRVVRPWSILMFHRVSTGADRADDARLSGLLRTARVLDHAIALIVGARVGMTPAEYVSHTEREFWITGADAVRARFADKEQP